MKVILSIDAVKHPLTGIGRYVWELGRGLKRQQIEDVLFYKNGQVLTAFPSLEPCRENEALTRLKKWAQNSTLLTRAYQIKSSWHKSGSLKGFEDYVFHGPNYYLPPFSGRSVVTIHDLSPFLWPECHPKGRVHYLRSEIEKSLKRATVLITDAEYTRQEVSRYFSWPLDRIFAVPLASSPEFHPRPESDLLDVLSRYHLEPGSYSLYVGTVEPRKNLSVLLEAYGKLGRKQKQLFPLVVAGYEGWASDSIHARMQAGQREGWLHYLGYVPQEVLPFLMAGARVFVYPSLYEGFGLPVLEALSSGVPVICSVASTLPEVGGDAVAYHEPGDVDTLMTLLQKALEDSEWRRGLREKGLKRAALFSWDRCVERTVQVYKVALAGSLG